MGPQGREGFTEFARTSAHRLCQTAYLLCGDWHLAEDLTQIALEKLYVAWRRIEHTDQPHAYAKRVLLNAYLDRRRRRSSTELPGIDASALEGRPDASADADLPDVRMTLIDALMRLPPRDRAVVVLRYWEDHSVEAVAEMLGMSASAVKSAGPRALARLRGTLEVNPLVG
ncbi:SigE family RNA polymerase sigma factor [Embleya sp. NPDC050493]|uniref:SigE family RNA polymerase sigma factor n=1 Tax=Embleya sp. NPDC050493 TaxID=3363989 RepID=UPI0037A5F451